MARVYTAPVPPSLNSLYRFNSKTRRMYKVTAATTYAESLKPVLYAQGLRPVESDKHVALTIRVYRPRKTGDIDNYDKLLLDSLQGVAYANDRQVRQRCTELHDDPKNPRVELEIEVL